MFTVHRGESLKLQSMWSSGVFLLGRESVLTFASFVLQIGLLFDWNQ